MNILKQFSFKRRNFFEKLTTPASDEDRIAERNVAILGWIICGAILCLICMGVWKVGELVFHAVI